MEKHNSKHNNEGGLTPDASLVIQSQLKPGPMVRIEARAFPGSGGTIVETINGYAKDTDAAVLGRALGGLIRNAWAMAQDIDRERGKLNPSVVDAILADWMDDGYTVCLRCGEDMQEGPGPACSRCGSADIYREADGADYRQADEAAQLDTMGRVRAVVRYARKMGFAKARVAVWDTDNPEGSAHEHPLEELQEYEVAPATGEHDLGLELYETVYSGIKPNPQDEEDEPLGSTFDTAEERDAWMAAEPDPAAGGEKAGA